MTASWTDLAACAGLDADLFFPPRGAALDGVAVCDACPVRAQCFVVHVDERFGIWGGSSERVRRVFRREHRALIVAAHGALGVVGVGHGRHSVAEQMLRAA